MKKKLMTRRRKDAATRNRLRNQMNSLMYLTVQSLPVVYQQLLIKKKLDQNKKLLRPLLLKSHIEAVVMMKMKQRDRMLQS